MYSDMAKSGVEEESIFNKVAESLRSEGITLKTVEEIERVNIRCIHISFENIKYWIT